MSDYLSPIRLNLEDTEKTAMPEKPSESPLERPLEKTKTVVPKKEYLLSDVELTLHAKAVRLLCLGYRDPDKIGLLRFAQLTNALWSAAKNDDPYAEWRLMELYNAMAGLDEEIKRLENRCQQRLSELRGLKITLYSNPDPYKLNLRFANPFSFLAAILMIDLDYVERQFYTLRRLGIVLEGQGVLTGYVPKVQEILRKPLSWANTGITRQDILDHNEKAQQVIQTFGEVPDAILKKTLTFAFLPKKTTKK
jgi:integrating conjugative element protein (TIGR03761 family)